MEPLRGYSISLDALRGAMGRMKMKTYKDKKLRNRIEE
jgi:hypothetical protein